MRAVVLGWLNGGHEPRERNAPQREEDRPGRWGEAERVRAPRLLETVKALTLWQPWAWWVVSGQKNIENRPWVPTKGTVGTTIAIHAGLTFDEKALLVPAAKTITDHSGETIHGAILGLVRVTGCVQANELVRTDAHASPWFFGPWGWTLDSFVKLKEPIPCKGALGLWRVPEEICEKITTQLR